MTSWRTCVGVAACGLLWVAGVAMGDLTTSTLTPRAFQSPYTQRWRDVANHQYGTAYMGSYNYSLADVQITFDDEATSLQGTMTAVNLKPNFAYQFKLEGSGPDTPGNQALGETGRWTGASSTSLGYRLFDYFITDANGNATLSFEVNSSYRVLWHTLQKLPTSSDGPLKSTTFAVPPDPDGAYGGTAYPSTTVGVFGQVEHAPVGGVPLPLGEYRAFFVLTEESFHMYGGTGGFWATVMGGNADFTIVAPAPGALVLAAMGLGLLGWVKRRLH